MTGEAAFRAGLLDPRQAVPTGLTGPDDDIAGRYAVYRNNVTVALIEALASAFPVVERLVGEAFFHAMAREFVRVHPPESPVMALYGSRFPGWIASFPPVAALPYLPEVAAIEQARRESYHAADAAPLAPEALAARSPEAMAALRPRPHPSARWVRCRHPSLAIWARNSTRSDLAKSPAGEVLICRPQAEVLISAAPLGTAETLAALAAGASLAEAMPTGADHGALFAALFAAGALILRGDNR
ncbi:HvfC/BufC N-terminal domain-containing protein [Roseivivax marinus]|uniref:HvfC/BufC N-terminal domain-containing protein n=1 Tax=Roseivivax marinus TaxID=1379903 RepID=UPI00273E024C|nr:DNA-binding domain-containing protein [Roseivivax marinus]